jgi:hypothetical protein
MYIQLLTLIVGCEAGEADTVPRMLATCLPSVYVSSFLYALLWMWAKCQSCCEREEECCATTTATVAPSLPGVEYATSMQTESNSP